VDGELGAGGNGNPFGSRCGGIVSGGSIAVLVPFFTTTWFDEPVWLAKEKSPLLSTDT